MFEIQFFNRAGKKVYNETVDTPREVSPRIKSILENNPMLRITTWKTMMWNEATQQYDIPTFGPKGIQ